MNIPRVAGNISLAVQMVFDRLISFLQRWLTLNVDAVANLAALAAIDATSITNGASKRVLTLRADFVLDKASALAPDGITVVAAVGGGRWIRTAPDQPDEVWQRQATWFINAVTGNDEAGGSTSPTAIKTWAELSRRLGTDVAPPQNVLVTIEQNMPDTDPISVSVQANGHTLQILGKTTVLDTSTVVSFSSNHAANNPCLLAINGFDAAGNVYRFIRFPDAVAAGVDAWSIVLADLGNGVGGTFRCARPIASDAVAAQGFSSATFDPINGTVCEVVSMPQVSIGALSVTSAEALNLYVDAEALTIQVMNLRVLRPANLAGSTWSTSTWYCTNAANCDIDCLEVTRATLSNCYTRYLQVINGSVQVTSGAVGAIESYGASVFLWSEPVLQATPGTTELWTIGFSTSLVAEGGFGYYPSAAALVVTDYSIIDVRFGKVFGDCNGVNGRISMSRNGLMSYQSGSLVFINPSAVYIEGQVITIANLPYVAPNGSGATPDLTIGSGNRRPLQAGIRGAVANGTTYAGTDLTGNVADTAFAIVTSTGFLKNLRGYAVTAAGGVTATVTVMINGVASTVTAATAAGGQTLSDTTHTVPVVAGDRISFRVVTTNVGYSDLSISAEIV